MRAGTVLLASILLASPAWAQVTVNPGALDALAKPQAPAPARPAPRPARPAPASTRPAAKPATRANPAAAPKAPAKPPTIPATPPAILALPPPVQVPVQRPPPPPPIPLADDAPGEITPIPGGMRVTFGRDRTELNPKSAAGLRQFAQSLKANEAASVNLYAYASGSTDDPSAPRRLSLARALAARAVLISEGIPSPRIYPRALGAAGGATDPDRVDLVAGAPTPRAAAPTSAASAPPAPTPAAPAAK